MVVPRTEHHLSFDYSLNSGCARLGGSRGGLCLFGNQRSWGISSESGRRVNFSTVREALPSSFLLVPLRARQLCPLSDMGVLSPLRPSGHEFQSTQAVLRQSTRCCSQSNASDSKAAAAEVAAPGVEPGSNGSAPNGAATASVNGQSSDMSCVGTGMEVECFLPDDELRAGRPVASEAPDAGETGRQRA
jgi:hypothetical protein